MGKEDYHKGTPWNFANISTERVKDQEKEKPSSRPELKDSFPAREVERRCCGRERDAGRVVGFSKDTDFVGEDVSDQDLWLILPDKMRDDILKSLDHWHEAKDAKLLRSMDERIIHRNHLETV